MEVWPTFFRSNPTRYANCGRASTWLTSPYDKITPAMPEAGIYVDEPPNNLVSVRWASARPEDNDTGTSTPRAGAHHERWMPQACGRPATRGRGMGSPTSRNSWCRITGERLVAGRVCSHGRVATCSTRRGRVPLRADSAAPNTRPTELLRKQTRALRGYFMIYPDSAGIERSTRLLDDGGEARRPSPRVNDELARTTAPPHRGKSGRGRAYQE